MLADLSEERYLQGSGGFTPGVNWQGHEADCSPPYSAEVKNLELYLHFPICFHGI
jgi:hypothetical protein